METFNHPHSPLATMASHQWEKLHELRRSKVHSNPRSVHLLSVEDPHRGGKGRPPQAGQSLEPPSGPAAWPSPAGRSGSRERCPSPPRSTSSPGKSPWGGIEAKCFWTLRRRMPRLKSVNSEVHPSSLSHMGSLKWVHGTMSWKSHEARTGSLKWSDGNWIPKRATKPPGGSLQSIGSCSQNWTRIRNVFK